MPAYFLTADYGKLQTDRVFNHSTMTGAKAFIKQTGRSKYIWKQIQLFVIPEMNEFPLLSRCFVWTSLKPPSVVLFVFLCGFF